MIFRQGLKLLGVLAVLGLFAPAIALAQGPMVGPTAGKLAVTPAGFDNMGDVLKKLGFQATEIQEKDLANLDTLKQFDAIYINCSSSIDSQAKDAAPALRQYVQDGGIIYASDWADSIMQTAFPGKINFYKGQTIAGIPQTEFSGSRLGVSGKVQAKVTDAGLESVLGKKAIEINYDLGGWVIVDSVGSGVRVLMTGPGLVYDTAKLGEQAMNELQNLNSSDPKAVEEFNKKMTSSTESKGDRPYVVAFPEGKGEVLYTTFHNEAQTTSDVQKVLNWFAIRAKAGKLARTVQELVGQNKDEVLQEVVDGIQQGETKSYTFEASGKAGFTVALNFGGSALNLSVVSPKGKTVLSQKVDQPPFTSKVKAAKGQFTMKVEGVDVPEQNMPFVLTIAGSKKAIATPATKQSGLNLGSRSVRFILLGIGIVIIVGATVVIITRRRRQGKQNV